MEQIGKYAYSTKTDLGFEETINKVTELLAEQGFGILTEIDVKGTLKKKIDVDYKPYRILGACNPPFAHESLKANEHIGVFLPCNVVVWDNGPDRTISIMNPNIMADIVDNEDISRVASDVADRLKKVVSAF